MVVGDLADCAVGGDGGVRGGGCWMFGGMTGGREKGEGKGRDVGWEWGGRGGGGGDDDKKCGKTIDAMRHQRQYPLLKNTNKPHHRNTPLLSNPNPTPHSPNNPTSPPHLQTPPKKSNSTHLTSANPPGIPAVIAPPKSSVCLRPAAAITSHFLLSSLFPSKNKKEECKFRNSKPRKHTHESMQTFRHMPDSGGFFYIKRSWRFLGSAGSGFM